MESNNHTDSTDMDAIAVAGSEHGSQCLQSDHAELAALATCNNSAVTAEPGGGHHKTSSEPHQHSESVPTEDSLRTAYLNSYVAEDTPNSVRMEHGKAFALALLRQNYPESGGFMIRPSSLGPMVKNGISFMLKADDGSNPDYVAPKPTSESKKGKKKKKLSKAQREQLRVEDYVTAFNHGIEFTMNVKWDIIEPEDIAGFVVLSKCTIHDDYRPLTYLALVIDDLSNFAVIAATNDLHRSDILADALCRNAKLQRGYGILLYGSRLEFYDFNSGVQTLIDSRDAVKGTVSMEDPVLALCAADLGEGIQDLAFDLCTTSLDMVNDVFATHIIPRQVMYIEDDEGAANDEAAADKVGDVEREGESVDGLCDSEPE